MIDQAKRLRKVGKAGGVKGKSVVFNVIAVVWITIFTLALFVPFYVVVVTSISPNLEIMSSMQFIWWPKNPTFQAYTEAFTNPLSFTMQSHSLKIFLGFWNTLWQTIPTVLIGLFVSGLSAYAFCRMNFVGKNVLFYITFATMLVPSACLGVVGYLMYDKLEWTGTVLPLIIPGMFGGGITVFFLRQFFSGVPQELFEAGKLDGMGHFRMYVQIMLPLTIPAFLAQFVFGFVSGYNNYAGPLLYLNGVEELYPMQLAMTNLQKQFVDLGLPVTCAFTVLGLLPPIIVFVTCQKFFIQGVAVTGLK